MLPHRSFDKSLTLTMLALWTPQQYAHCVIPAAHREVDAMCAAKDADERENTVSVYFPAHMMHREWSDDAGENECRNFDLTIELNGKLGCGLKSCFFTLVDFIFRIPIWEMPSIYESQA
jgi:hypothetical protein